MTEYHEYAEDVLVVATWGEAVGLGAVTIGAVTSFHGRRVISAAAGPRAVEGMRIANISWTPAALEHRNHELIWDALARSQANSRLS